MFDHRRKQRGIALAYVGVFVFMLALMIGLAVDLGRAYAVRSELAKAVDASALAAARLITSGQTAATNEANAIFTLNFPSGHLGVDSVSGPDINFGSVASGPNAGAHLITVSASATLPTTFMALAGNQTIDIPAAGQATRRLVDISFVIDHSGSLSSVWSQVQTAANRFVDFFDDVNDRMALVMFAYDAVVADAISTSRGYNKNNIKGHINLTQAEGSTSTAEGLFRGWDQLRRVPTDVQSGLRVIVLFTDGAPNTFAGTFRRRAANNSTDTNWSAQLGSMLTGDFPPGSPSSQGLRLPYSATCCSTLTTAPSCITPGGCWKRKHGRRPALQLAEQSHPGHPRAPERQHARRPAVDRHRRQLPAADAGPVGSADVDSGDDRHDGPGPPLRKPPEQRVQGLAQPRGADRERDSHRHQRRPSHAHLCARSSATC
jgi:Flp pilus assembly protein TadG